MRVNLNNKSIEYLANIIAGEEGLSPYRSGPKLIAFFRDFGERDLYGNDFGSRVPYVIGKIQKLNGTDHIKGIIESAFDYFDNHDLDPKPQAEKFNGLLVRYGVRLVVEHHSGFMQGRDYIKGPPYFELVSIKEPSIQPIALVRLNHQYINEQLKKGNRRLQENDASGAITIAYTLVEDVIKKLLTELDCDFNLHEGDIRKLYGRIRKELKLDPKAEELDDRLKSILDGLSKIIGGLYDVSNKAGDRHARRYNPKYRHAKLALNTSVTISEFLVETDQSRQT